MKWTRKYSVIGYYMNDRLKVLGIYIPVPTMIAAGVYAFLALVVELWLRPMVTNLWGGPGWVFDLVHLAGIGSMGYLTIKDPDNWYHLMAWLGFAWPDKKRLDKPVPDVLLPLGRLITYSVLSIELTIFVWWVMPWAEWWWMTAQVLVVLALFGCINALLSKWWLWRRTRIPSLLALALFLVLMSWVYQVLSETPFWIL